MKAIKKTIRALGAIVRNPWLLNRVLQEPLYWREYVSSHHSREAGLPVISLEQLFGEHISEQLSLFTFLDGGSLVTDIALLKLFARKIPNCRYFEIGTWRGESVVNVAEVAHECYTLNLSDEELRSMNVSEAYIQQQAYFSKGKTNINHLKGNSKNFDFRKINKNFDLVFIDGSHHYEEVRNDTEKVFHYLAHEESIIVWHDYGVTPEEIRYEVFAGILDGLPEELHHFLYHVSNTKSAVFIRRNLKGQKLVQPVMPRTTFRVSIDYK